MHAANSRPLTIPRLLQGPYPKIIPDRISPSIVLLRMRMAPEGAKRDCCNNPPKKRDDYDYDSHGFLLR